MIKNQKINIADTPQHSKISHSHDGEHKSVSYSNSRKLPVMRITFVK